VPKRTRKQRAQIRAVNTPKTKRALRYAWRLSPYLAAWEAEGLSQEDIAGALNACGAPVPSEYDPDSRHAPTPRKKWTRSQVQRLLKWRDEAKRKMTFWAKRKGLPSVPVYGGGNGLFAEPRLAPLPAWNRPNPAYADNPYGPPLDDVSDEGVRRWREALLASTPHEATRRALRAYWERVDSGIPERDEDDEEWAWLDRPSFDHGTKWERKGRR
jgi:hypothetical protein